MRKRSKVATLVFALFILSTTAVYAELSPQVYQSLQQEAQEYYLIETVKVSSPFRLFRREKPVTVTATILEVYRSSRDISAGDTIEIRYMNYRPPRHWVGPRPIPVLARGERYHAFLSRSDTESYYVPAARGASFESPVVVR